MGPCPSPTWCVGQEDLQSCSHQNAPDGPLVANLQHQGSNTRFKYCHKIG
jgi:hypothetical protein